MYLHVTMTTTLRYKKTTSKQTPKSRMYISQIISALAILASVSAVEERCKPKVCKGIKCLKDLESFPRMELVESSKKYVHRIDLHPEFQKLLHGNLADAAKNFGGNVFVLIKDLIRQVRATARKFDRVLIDGAYGAGRSVLLMQTYAGVRESVASDRNKIILYVPNAPEWTSGKYPHNPVMVNGKIEYQQPELALEILRLMLIENGDKMPKGLAEKIEFAKLDVNNRAIPLYEKTLKQLCDRDFILFMGGVDGLLSPNSLTGYKDVNGNPLPLKDLTLSASLFSGFKGKIIGTLIGSESSATANLNKKDFALVTIPNYSCVDAKRVMQLYIDLGHCSANKIEMLSNCKDGTINGKDLYMSCLKK